jgi:lysozyme family protein
VQAGALGGLIFTQRETPVYQTASAPAAATSQTAFAIVRFDPQARADEITQLLEANRVNIVSGPTAGGLYQLGAAQGPLSDAETAAVIDRLQHDKNVNFVAAKK